MTANATQPFFDNATSTTSFPVDDSTLNSAISVPNAEEHWTRSSTKLQHEINFYYKIIVFIIGCTGNVINVIIMQLITVQTVTRITITILALSDLLFLIFNIPTLIYPKFKNMSFYDVSSTTCKMTIFTGTFFAFVSCFMVALLTVERTIAVSIPLKAKQILSTNRVMIGMLTVVISYMSWVGFCTADYQIQPVNDEYGIFLFNSCLSTNYWQEFHYSFLILETAIPLCVVVIGNIVTGVVVARKIKTRAQLTGQDSQHKDSSQLILTTVSISAAFVLLTSPLGIFIAFGEKWVGEEVYNDYNSIYYLTLDCLYYTNFSINFFFYVAFTKSFRDKLKFLLKRMNCTSLNNPQHSVETNSTSQSSL